MHQGKDFHSMFTGKYPDTVKKAQAEAVAKMRERKNHRVESLINTIEAAYGHVAVTRDQKNPGKYIKSYDHSITVEMFQMDLPILQEEFPNFTFKHVVGIYYLVAFNKPDNWIELRMPEV